MRSRSKGRDFDGGLVHHLSRAHACQRLRQLDRAGSWSTVHFHNGLITPLVRDFQPSTRPHSTRLGLSDMCQGIDRQWMHCSPDLRPGSLILDPQDQTWRGVRDIVGVLSCHEDLLRTNMGEGGYGGEGRTQRTAGANGGGAEEPIVGLIRGF